MSIKIKELPEEERPYEKLELYGEKVLSNAELLAIIIKSGTKKQSSVETAQKILQLDNTEKGGLDFLNEVSIEEFMTVEGIGRIKAIQLKAVCELSKRMKVTSNYKKIVVKKPDDLADFLMDKLKNEKQEIVKVVILDSKNQILKIVDVALGAAGFVNVSTANILSEVIKMKAPKMILVHNHPTGDPTPSKADIVFTKKIYEAAGLMDIELLDHLVIGDMKYKSIFSDVFLKE